MPNFRSAAEAVYSRRLASGWVVGREELARECAKRTGHTLAESRRLAGLFLAEKKGPSKFKMIRRPPRMAWSSGFSTQFRTVFIDIAWMNHCRPADNDGNAGFLLACSSWVQLLATAPVRDKSFTSLEEGLTAILKAMPDVRVVLTDSELTFRSKRFSRLVRARFGVNLEILAEPRKAFLAEAHIYQVRSKLGEAMEELNTGRWVDLLPAVTRELNRRRVPGTDVRKCDVTRENVHAVMERSLGIADFAGLIRTSLVRERQIAASRVLSSLFELAPGDRVRAALKSVVRRKQTAWIKSSAAGYLSPGVYAVRERRMSTCRKTLGVVLSERRRVEARGRLKRRATLSAYRIGREEGGPALRRWFYPFELRKVGDAQD